MEGVEFDPELKYVLRGHKSIITCVDSLQGTTILMTGDDNGEIRIWELGYMRCLQALKLTRWLGGIRFIADHLLYSDSRINLLKLEHFGPPAIESDTPIHQTYHPHTQVLWVFTRKDARQIDVKTGRIRQIFILCGEGEEIVTA